MKRDRKSIRKGEEDKLKDRHTQPEKIKVQNHLTD